MSSKRKKDKFGRTELFRVQDIRTDEGGTGIIDPVREVEAFHKSVQIGLGNPDTRQRVAVSLGLDIEEIDAENERDKFRLAATGWDAAALQSYQTFVDSRVDADAARWAEIASLWQPVGGDA